MEILGPVRVERLIPGGQGVGTLENGKKVLLWNVLPGELVEFRLTRDKAKYCEGVAIRILESVAGRVEPRDACYLATSPWQIMSYEAELAQKRILVEECLRQQGVVAEVEAVRTDGREFYYRNKMEYALYWNKEKSLIELAFHERGRHSKMPIEQSSLEMPVILQTAKDVVAELNVRHEEARKYQSLLVRANQRGEARVALFENGKAHPTVEPLKDEILGYEYSYAVDGFFQINLPVYEMALLEMREYVLADRVLDLYAGVGTIGLSVARGRVLQSVEINKQAYAELTENAKNASDDIFKPKVYLEKAENVLDYITDDITVILDPPRAGCDKALMERLGLVRPPVILYLSCNPITAARDLAILGDHYAIEKIVPFNFFPKTPHIEMLIVLKRRV